MREANGWHHNEQVYIQAHSGGLALLQYLFRSRIPGRFYVDGNIQTKSIAAWNWVPVEDIAWNWEVRKLA